MNEKILTIFLSKKNKYYDININLISNNNCDSCLIPEHTDSEGCFSYLSTKKIFTSTKGYYTLFIDDDTQLNPAHFHEIVSQLHNCEKAKELYRFQELYFDKDKWIPSVNTTHTDNFREFSEHTKGINGIIFNKNFLSDYLLAYSKLSGNIFNEEHILFHIYKNTLKTQTNKILLLKKNQDNHDIVPDELNKIFSDFSHILEYEDDSDFIAEICKMLTHLLSNIILEQKNPLERLDLFLTIKKYLIHLWPKQIEYINIFNQRVSFQFFATFDPVQFLNIVKILN